MKIKKKRAGMQNIVQAWLISVSKNFFINDRSVCNLRFVVDGEDVIFDDDDELRRVMVVAQEGLAIEVALTKKSQQNITLNFNQKYINFKVISQDTKFFTNTTE